MNNRYHEPRLPEESTISSFLTAVYSYMFFALTLTAVTAYCIGTTPGIAYRIVTTPLLFYGMLLTQLALVLGLTAFMNRLSFAGALTLFVAYALATGVTFSVLFLAYSLVSIAQTFIITAATFAVMSLYGYTTQRDLSTMGNIALMAVIGLVIASVVNLFLGSTLLDFAISGLGVLVFTALIAYDTQKLKLLAHDGSDDHEMHLKAALFGALMLYLDFINLFIYLLRFLGKKKD